MNKSVLVLLLPGIVFFVAGGNQTFMKKRRTGSQMQVRQNTFNEQCVSKSKCVCTSSQKVGSTAKFELPPLGYAYDALEPYIDAQTMELHHNKHHAAYVNNLNNALKDFPELQDKTVTELVMQYDKLPKAIAQTVRNNAGGHLNHTMFWTLLKKDGGEPKGKLHDAICRDFQTIEAFKEQFNKAAKSVFGSGWAWLCLNKEGRLVIVSTLNQDSPLRQGLQPILGLDVWEHAYYLKYQNRRPDYIDAWWHVINWDRVTKNLEMLVV